MPSHDTVLIPLRARDGLIRAHAIIDAADADFVNQWRWHLASDGYVVRNARIQGQQRTIRLHRLLMGLTHTDREIIDHINRIRHDCRRTNLRVIPGSANQQNLSARSGVTSRHRGVSWYARDGVWVAMAMINGKYTYLGRFASEAEAANAARNARLTHMPYATD